MKFSKFICHQIPERSFKYKNYVFPICSRCTGIYLGIIVGFFFTIFIDLFKINTFYPIVILTIMLIPTAIDGFGQLFGFWKSNNIRRFFTGWLTGLGGGMAIRFILFYLVTIF